MEAGDGEALQAAFGDALCACVDVPALALQLVLREHPAWQADPVVVVEDDRPLAQIVWANRVARSHGIVRGMNFAASRALCATLHAEVVAQDAIDQAIDALFEKLLPFSPHIEPVLAQPGLFWIDPRGLAHLFGELELWAAAIVQALEGERYVATVVVGSRRASVYALARSRRGSLVLRDREHEQRLCEQVPLDRLELDPKLARELARLGVSRVGELLRLGASELRVRYGPEAAQWHSFLNGTAWTPLLPRTPSEVLAVELEVDPPDDDCTRLLFGLKAALQKLIERLRPMHCGIRALSVVLRFERAVCVGDQEVLREQRERIEAAAPTLDVVQWVDLLRLRLHGVSLPARVESIALELEHVRVHPRQLAIEHGKKPRDLEAANRAIARLRASFGPAAVTCAQLRQAHLPEGGFRLEPTMAIRLPKPGTLLGELPLMRRVYPTPIALPPRPNHEPENWLQEHGAVKEMHGPYRVAGGWWTRRRERDYYFAETKLGEVLWIFYDRVQRAWFLHGEVD